MSITGEQVTGSEVTVTATVDDVPVRDGDVLLDGEQVATTDRQGRATVALPTKPGNVSVAVERDAVSGNTTVVLARLCVATSPSLPLALPVAGQTVNATMDGDPVTNATVTVGGEPTARTGAAGQATVGMPLAASAKISVSKYGQTATTTVNGLFVNAAGVVLSLGVLLAGTVVGARRRNVTPGTLWGWVRAARELAVGALVGVAVVADDLLGRFRTRLELTAAALRDLFTGHRSPAALLDALRAWISERFAAAEDAASDAVAAVSTTESNGDNGTLAARVTIREAWTRFLTHVSLRRYWTRTPGEIATHAIERDGLPPAAVRTVRDAFRAVEYGQRDPQEHVAAVEDAIRHIETAAGQQSSATDDTDDATEGRPDAPANGRFRNCGAAGDRGRGLPRFRATAAGESLVAVLGSVAPTTILLAGSLTVGLCAVLAGWLGGLLGGGSPTAFDVAVDSPPEDVTATESRLFAADIDAAIDDAVAGDDAAMDTVTERLTAAATTAYAIGAGVSQRPHSRQFVRGRGPTTPSRRRCCPRRSHSRCWPGSACGSTRRASAAAASAGRSTLSHRCREVSADDAPPCAALERRPRSRAVSCQRLAFDRRAAVARGDRNPAHLRRLRRALADAGGNRFASNTVRF